MDRRNSKIELLKVIAIVMIIISHSLPRDGNVDSSWYVNIRRASNDYKHLTISVLSYLGQIGNGIFIVCSSWFLSGCEKIHKKKIVGLWFDTVIVSWSFLLICFVFHSPSKREIMGALFPVTFQSYWFVTCYICFYCVVPFLNIIINKIEKKVHFQIIVVFIALYMIINMAIPISGEYYYASDLVSCIQIFFIVSYMKKYYDIKKLGYKLAFGIWGGALLTLVFMIILTNTIGLRIDSLSGQMLHWASINNPLIIIAVIFWFIIHNKMEPTNIALINRISSLSFLIYLLHANPLYSYYIRTLFYNKIVGEAFANSHPLTCVCILAIMQLSFSCIFAFVYEKLLTHLRAKVIGIVTSGSQRAIDRLYSRFG